MPISPYVAALRWKVGSELLLLPSVAVVVRDGEGRLLLVRDRDSGEWGSGCDGTLRGSHTMLQARWPARRPSPGTRIVENAGSVRGDLVLGVETDEMDVQGVAVYRHDFGG